MIRRPPRSTQSRSSAASDVYKRQTYDYDEKNNLTRVRFPDGTVRQYHYENNAWPNHLTGLTDRTGNRYASWTYNEAGIAVSSSHANNIEKVSLSIDEPEVVGDIGITTVTNSVGAQSTYSWRRDPDTGAGLLLDALGPGCVSCPITGRHYTYDCLLYTSPSPRDQRGSRMPSSA